MPAAIQFQSTSDAYSEALTIGPFQSLSTVQFTVANASVLVQVAKKNPLDNSVHFDPSEVPFVPGMGGYSGKVYGIRFRSAVAGTPAVVVATAYFEDDPVPFNSPQPFDGTVAPGGGFTPPSSTGIQFDTPNVGGTLDVETDDGQTFTDNGVSGTGILFEELGTAPISFVGSGPISFDNTGSGNGIIFNADSNFSVNTATGNISFFAAANIDQSATGDGSFTSGNTMTVYGNNGGTSLGSINSVTMIHGTQLFGAVATVSVPVSSAEILASGGVPKELVPAPGAGLFILVTGISIQLLDSTVGYVLTGALRICAGNPNLSWWTDSTIQIITATNGLQSYTPLVVGTDAAEFDNQAVVLRTNDGSDPTLGDGDIVISLTYAIMPIS